MEGRALSQGVPKYSGTKIKKSSPHKLKTDSYKKSAHDGPIFIGVYGIIYFQ